MKHPILRGDLAELPVYRAGERPSVEGSHSLASNESHLGALPGVMEAIEPVLHRLNRYPDPSGAALAKAIAEFLSIDVESIVLGTGSVGVCQQIVTAACAPGDEVIHPWRSFEAYPIISRLASARSVEVPLTDDGSHDLSAMAAAVSERTRVIFVCTPNNPTGTALTREELDDFLDRVSHRVLVVIDGAYREYVEHNPAARGLADCLSAASGRANVVVLRTFSKAYGLAGLRVGYGIAVPGVAEVLRKTAMPFGVSSVAQAAALASLAAQDELRLRVLAVSAERARVVARARALGWEIPESHGNFYWLALGDRSEEFARDCLRAGVSVRSFPGEGVRVSVAEPEAGDRVQAVLEHFSPPRAE
ncbi:MAG: histidinol-phosphate transaminase [Candidatus Nanopelagicales bacterium]|nr:histidinol-phosphate transaminase [Candidatus Nanopelagicales bacterium]MDZ4249415.1 histidinol-phosphate transaminase [Candidatus Nanopelagicales bacterium]